MELFRPHDQQPLQARCHRQRPLPMPRNIERYRVALGRINGQVEQYSTGLLAW